MKKLIKWILIIVGILLVLLIAAAIALPFVLPLEKIKDIATEKISETINRKVTVEKVSFNILSGIKLEKLSIGNRPGFARRPFVSADAISLRYAFWPLFKRQVIIKEFRLEKPEILIEKNKSGEFNFSDMAGKKAAPKKKPEAKKPTTAEEKGLPFSIVMDTFSIRRARITYIDYGTNTSSELKNADLTISGITLALIKPIDFKFSATANYQKKDIPISFAGKINLDLAKESIKIPALSLGVAGEKAVIAASVAQLTKGPLIDFSIKSKKLSVDPLLAVFTAGATEPKPKAKLAKGEITKTVNKAMAGVPQALKIKGDIDIGNFTFQNFKVDKFKLGLSLANKKAYADIKEIKFYEGTLTGKGSVNLAAPGLSYSVTDLKLTNFNSTPFVNAVVETFLTRMKNYKDLVDKLYGRLNMNLSLSGSGVETEDILKNAAASGSLKLSGGEIKQTKILAQVGKTIKSTSLQEDIKFDELSAEFTLKNQVVNVKDLKLEGGDIKAGFKGSANIGSLKWVAGNRLSLKLSPAATKGLSKEYNLFRDKNGWLELSFELTGSFTRTIPVPVLEKPAEKVMEKVKEKAQEKIEQEKERLKEEARKKAEAEKKRLEEEAKKKAAEEAKKQLKNLIKF